MDDLLNRITSNLQICGGEPCIQGTRIPVQVILSHLAAGDSTQTVLEQFPRLNSEDIQACLQYAAYLCTEKSIAS